MILPSFPSDIIDPVIAEATHNRELFRLHATRAFAAFSRDDRKYVAILESDGQSAYTFFSTWSQRTLPALQQLSELLDDASFHDEFANRLLVDSATMTTKLQLILDERRNELQEELLDHLYPISKDADFATSHRQAQIYLNLPTSTLVDIIERYESYLSYRMVASMYHIPVTDQHSSWLERRKSAKQIAKDRETIETTEQTRLLAIGAERETILGSYDGLIKKLFENGWDLITVISLRNNYEKRLKAMPAADSKKSLNRLAVFEKVTKTFKNDKIEQLTTSNTLSLSETRQAIEKIDQLLLTIFDLSNADKNRLLILSKRARELDQEHNQILSERAERHLIINTSF